MHVTLCSFKCVLTFHIVLQCNMSLCGTNFVTGA